MASSQTHLLSCSKQSANHQSFVATLPFPLFQPPKVEESTSGLEPADPDFYRIGYVRSMQAYEIDFKEGPDGFGVYASKDVEPLRRPRVIMEIPLELMLTISKMLLWMLFPDIIPIGHPIFDIINSTNPEEELLELQDPNLASTNLILNYLFYSSKFDPLKHQSYYEGLLLSSF